jgi:uncharacterized protein YutE (UPF0331/DUF86 family)
VHLYGEIDNEYIYEFLKSDLDDITQFKKTIIQNISG